MAEDKSKAFEEAYNNFDLRPLSGKTLEKFYVGDFIDEHVANMVTTVRMTERYRKILLIGHRGCGKSTILNKVAEELKEEYHIVSFTAQDVLNMMDVETVDILLTTYMQLIRSMRAEGIPRRKSLFDKMVDAFKKNIRLKEISIEADIPGIDFLNTLSTKIIVETDSRNKVRKSFRTRIEILQKDLSGACTDIRQLEEKDVLIIIDDLDKLDTKFAERVFFDDVHLLNMPEVKIIYTFPLDTYYSERFIPIRDRYENEYISLVNLYNADATYREEALEQLKKVVFKRIDERLVSERALKMLVDMSGGLLRDLIKFMQDACKIAVMNEADRIDETIAQHAIDEHVNDYFRLFDYLKYQRNVREVCEGKDIGKEDLIYLLRYLFVLEYRSQEKDNIWFDAHPCLKAALSRRK